MTFTLPELPYAHDALGPYMSKETLEYHHDKHHLAYVNNGNNLLKGTEWEGKSLEEIVTRLVRQEPRPLQQRRPALQPRPFLEVDEAERRRQDPGRAREGAGRFLRLGRQGEGRFHPGGHDPVRLGLGLARRQGRQDRPRPRPPTAKTRSCTARKPILGVDVWEHSYYIDYRNRRPDYLKAFVDSLVNWEYVAELYEAAVK